MIIIHGARDDRIPLSAVDDAVRAISRQGVRVTSQIHPEGDHFLFFSNLEKVLDEIGAWMAGIGQE